MQQPKCNAIVGADTYTGSHLGGGPEINIAESGD